MGKRLAAMRANPQGGWRIEDVIAVCRQQGLECRPPRGGGSHYKVAHPDLPEMLTVPFARPIKAVYIRKLVQMADAVSKT